MKKSTSIGLAMLIALSSSATFAEEYTGSAQIASSKIKNVDDRGFTAIVSGSMKLDDMIDMEGFSAEAEFSKSLTTPAGSSASGGGTTIKSETSYWSLGAYGAYTYPVNDEISVKGRVGLVYLSMSFDSSCSGTGCAFFSSSSASDSETELAFGVTGTYAFKDDMDIIAEFTKIDQLSHIGIGVAMPFEL